MPERYEQAYHDNPTLFGTEPSPLLTRFCDAVGGEAPVLDIGVGQGRNALALLQRGHRVLGVDPCDTGFDAARDAARAMGCDRRLELLQAGFDSAQIAGPFSAVLCFGLVQILDRSQITTLRRRVHEWLGPGGLLLLVAWHEGDPALPGITTDPAWTSLGEGSFHHGDGRLRTFLGAGEVAGWFDRGQWSILHHREHLGPWHRHGADGELEQHGDVEVAVRRAR